MSARAMSRGWLVHYDEKKGEWLWTDTEKPMDLSRACKLCKRMPTVEGHDACFGTLEGVISACCGHGIHHAVIKWEAENVR